MPEAEAATDRDLFLLFALLFSLLDLLFSPCTAHKQLTIGADATAGESQEYWQHSDYGQTQYHKFYVVTGTFVGIESKYSKSHSIWLYELQSRWAGSSL